jgi:hypothetical protein
MDSVRNQPGLQWFLRPLQFVWLSLAIYASSFLLVPLFRWVLLQFLNRRIRSRNALRKDTTPRLLKALAEKADKLESSRAHAMGPFHL